ncbi:MAG: serpin family protein [Clostridia bacterium]
MRLYGTLILSVLVTVCIAIAGCGAGDGEPAEALPDPVEELDKNLVRANTQFAIDMARQLRGKDPEDDLFFSPASISVALAMTKNGAAAETFDALSQTLGFGEMSREAVNRGFRDLLTILRNPDPEVELDIANSIWAREGLPFKEEFLKANDEYYDATTRELDFEDPAARDTINEWVAQATGDKIEEMVEEIRADSIMFLINAVYFQGEWSEEFDPGATRSEDFHRSDDSVISTPFMHAEERTCPYYEDDKMQGVSLPYGEGRLGMYILLPSEESNIDELLADLDAQKLQDILSGFSEREIDVSVPKFKIEYEKALDEVLKDMGMEIAFDRERADFSRMYPITQGQNVYIGEVLHKSFVEVDEEGTEAAAATSVEIRIESARVTTEFKADRPFLFLIRDDVTGTILFCGIVEGMNF